MEKIRLECLSHYSNGVLQCACCGENNPNFLAIDHIKKNGAEHRKEIGGSGYIYYWLKKISFLKDLECYAITVIYH